MMAAIVLALKRLVGHEVGELHPLLTHVLKSEETVKGTTQCPHTEMMETLYLAMAAAMAEL